MRQPKVRRTSRRPERVAAFNKAVDPLPADEPARERIGALPPCPTLAGYDRARVSTYDWAHEGRR